MKKFLNESDKKKIISEKEKMIIESFAKTFNKIKRIDENEINENVDYTQEELDEYFNAKNELFEIIGNETNEVDIPKRLMKLKNKGVKFIPEIIKEKIFPKNEWWENRFRQTTTFDFVDEESGDVYSFIADDEDWWEGMPTLHPYSKHELSFLYENNLINNAPKNAMDGIKFKNASPDLSNANLHSINEKSGNKLGGDSPYFETLSQALDAVREYATKLGYELDEDTIFTHFGTGGISYETYKSANIPLLKNGEPILNKSGKEMNRAIHVSIYRMPSGKYELTMYKTY